MFFGSTSSSYDNIKVDQIEEELKNGATLVDIRNNSAYSAGHIEGAVNIPIKSLPFKMKELDKDKPVVVICYVGGSSKMASKLLSKSGYTVKNVIGGMQAWNGKVVTS